MNTQKHYLGKKSLADWADKLKLSFWECFMSKYKFNPERYGFEPVDKFPELAYQYPLNTGNWFIKITEYANYGRLVYWYSAIQMNFGLGSDDRVRILGCSHDSAKPLDHKKQNSPSIEYCGLISTHRFAVQLLKHLLGTTKNESVKKEGKERLFSCKGKLMRSKFNYS